MKKLSTLCILMLAIIFVKASDRPSLGVANIDPIGVNEGSNSLTSMVRMEIEKQNKYDVIDRYEVENYYKLNNLTANGCMSKTCVLSLGDYLKLNYIVTGSVEKLGDKLVITLKQYDVESRAQVSSVVKEYIYETSSIQTLVGFAVANMLGDKEISVLEDLYDYNKVKSDVVNKPNVRALNLSGPRFGVSYISGDMGDMLTRDENLGGFNMYPAMTQIGYHKEFRYINTGNVMALVEFIGLIGGLDQQRAVPSISIMNGFRFRNSKIEFGFGPTFTFRKMAKGFTDNNGNWHLESDKNLPAFEGQNLNIEKKLDSRGNAELTTGWVFAVGRTFSSGNLNIPLNFYTIPNKDGWTYGISMGWSIEKK